MRPPRGNSRGAFSYLKVNIMVANFNSSKFFNDSYFCESVTFSGTVYPALINDYTLEDMSNGGTMSKQGKWLEITIKNTAFTPNLHSEITYKSETFRIEEIADSGNDIILKCIADLRRKTR